MLSKLESGIQELRENISRELGSIIKNQADLKNTIIEMKNNIRMN